MHIKGDYTPIITPHCTDDSIDHAAYLAGPAGIVKVDNVYEVETGMVSR